MFFLVLECFYRTTSKIIASVVKLIVSMAFDFVPIDFMNLGKLNQFFPLLNILNIFFSRSSPPVFLPIFNPLANKRINDVC